jgi:hypothetical protein
MRRKVRCQVGCHNIFEIWRLGPLYLMWCFWRERNALNFEDRETLMVELKKIIFNSIYTWTTAHNSFFSSFPIFLNFCSSFSNE